MMEGDRKRSKGGFFHLFDWNGKSRKKLFTNNSELPEPSTQGTEKAQNMARMGLNVIDVDDRRGNLSNNGSSDFSCASSVTSDDGCGTRAPGVVARLMGLDSLPTSNVVEPTSTPCFDSSSLRGSQHDKSTPTLWSEYNSTGYLNTSNKQDGGSWNSVESRMRKAQNRPIERFQRESLPPKSAKPIPITHHKLLSPVKNPGFIPTKNAAYVMEAAAKIIEASPKATTNGKVPSIGSSSVPLRIRDLKQKIEAANTASRPPKLNPCTTTNMKGQHSDKSQGRLEGISSSKASLFSESGASGNLQKKGKSVSLAAQARANQRKEGPIPQSSSIMKQKTQNEVKSNHSPKPLAITQGIIGKRSAESQTNNVLGQNNQKQNCVSNKRSSTSKPSVSNKQGTKAHSTSGFSRPNRASNKGVAKTETVSRKTSMSATDSEKGKSNISQKKQSINGDLKMERSVSSDSASLDNRSVKCNLAIDGCVNVAKDNVTSGMDVVSFTFTSPMKRTTPSPQPSGQIVEKSTSAAIDSSCTADNNLIKNLKISFPGLNVIGGDALGVLLEQKLRELTSKVESSNCNIIRDDTSSCSISTSHDKSAHRDCLDCCSLEDSQSTENQKLQQPEEMEERGNHSNGNDTGKEVDCRSVSSTEPSFTSECYSSTIGSMQYSPAYAQVMFDWISTIESLEAEVEPDLSDTASSISMDKNLVTRAFTKADIKQLSNWELDYVREILQNTELQLKDIASDQTPAFITPNLFDQLENQENGTKRSEEGYAKLERKMIFDCVGEYLNVMSGKISVGSFTAWEKFQTWFRSKGWLAEELHKEILGWKSMGDMMVDELVDKDMSSKYGRWLDFDMEALEEGVEVGNRILTSLLDELISDLLFL